MMITCGEHTFRVHSLMMCLHFDYFATHGDAFTRFQGFDPHHVYLSEEIPVFIEKMIRLIYMSDYIALTSAYETEPKPLSHSIDAYMYSPGDCYGICSLKWLAAGESKRPLKVSYQMELNAFSEPRPSRLRRGDQNRVHDDAGP